MKYLGAKHLIGNYISTYINSIVTPDIVDGYLEPFAGSLGVFKEMIKYNYKKYIASDLQPDIILMWKKLQNNQLILPKTFDEELWIKLKNTQSPNALKAVAGFGMSFGGQYFSGYIQKYANGSNRDFYKEFLNSLNKIKKLIQKSNIKFYNKSYDSYKPVNMLIYCDPPYKNTVGYDTGNFDHNKFWEVMRIWSKKNYVFISEEKAPNDFKVVWKKIKRRTLNSSTRSNKIEKIYVYKYGMVYNKLINKKYTQKICKSIHTKHKISQKTRKR
tara:strand:+ start:226 stop:1041 length:816 start_codon:yes stop_codon:yes gene_type:complete